MDRLGYWSFNVPNLKTSFFCYIGSILLAYFGSHIHSRLSFRDIFIFSDKRGSILLLSELHYRQNALNQKGVCCLSILEVQRVQTLLVSPKSRLFLGCVAQVALRLPAMNLSP